MSWAYSLEEAPITEARFLRRKVAGIYSSKYF